MVVPPGSDSPMSQPELIEEISVLCMTMPLPSTQPVGSPRAPALLASRAHSSILRGTSATSASAISNTLKSERAARAGDTVLRRHAASWLWGPGTAPRLSDTTERLALRLLSDLPPEVRLGESRLCVLALDTPRLVRSEALLEVLLCSDRKDALSSDALNGARVAAGGRDTTVGVTPGMSLARKLAKSSRPSL